MKCVLQTLHIWTMEEEKCLVAARLAKEEEFCGTKSHDTLWSAIRGELQNAGVNVTKNQMINKWKSLKKNLKK